MTSQSTRVLFLGTCLFVMGAILVFMGLGDGSRRLLSVGAGVVCLSALVLGVGGRLGRARKTPLEARREQRLWRSGPLGRLWLRARRKLP